MCEMRFYAADPSHRLMINFEKFEISDCSIELKIIGTGSDVSINCYIFVCLFSFNDLSILNIYNVKVGFLVCVYEHFV